VSNAGFEDLYLGGNLPAQYAGDVPAGAFPVGAAPAGWTAWYSTGSSFPGTNIGVLNPGRVVDDGPAATFFPGGAPEGDNALLLYFGNASGGLPYGVTQVLNDTLQAGITYTLQVEVGNIDSGQGFVEPYAGFGYFDIKGFPGYRVQLLAGTTLLAEDDDTLAPSEGQWATSSVVFTADEGHPALGSSLEIRLITLDHATTVPNQSGIEVDFDDVRLDASPADAALPLASSAGTWLLSWLMLASGMLSMRQPTRGAPVGHTSCSARPRRVW
jgi:hypothetical protein